MNLTFERNGHGIRVKRWCASCQHKEVENDGTRVCQKMQLMVARDFVCRQWLMSDGLRNAGLQNHGVVRWRGTKEIIIK